jgi:hypothetical protein
MAELSDSAASGSRIETLRALRDVLARDIEDAHTPAAAKAAMARQVVLILAEIDALAPPKVEVNPLDELANRRRAAGLSDASGKTRTGR